MKIRINLLRIILLLAIVFLMLLGCRGIPKEIPDDLHPEEFFKLAQNAIVDWGNYRAALFYYEEFIERFPNMPGKIVEAEYEIAFIHYKRKNYEEAQARFNLILEKYQTQESIHFQEWPKILSEKILATIETRQRG